MGLVYPDVPNLPGVPALLRNPALPIPGLPPLLTGDLIGALADLTQAAWGIFDSNGHAVIDADTTYSFEYKQDWRLSDYPQEPNAFTTYNKVNTPFDVRLVFAAGGSEQNRSQFLASIDAIAGDTNLYDVVTPEKAYTNCNVTHYDLARSAENGVGLIRVAIYLLQIRQSGQQKFTTVKVADSSPAVHGGTVQPAAPPSTSALFDLFH